MGSSRLVGHWARLPRFGGWCAVVGRPLCSVGGLQAREWPAEIQIKASLSPSSPLRDRGKKMNSVVQNDTVLLFFFFFFFVFECMKRRRFGENAPFHLNVAPKRAKFQISPQSSFLSSIASLPISVSVPLVGRVFHFSPWSLIYAIEPLIDQKTSNFFN
jgi:hypothetical protein